ncbi:MAG: 16S rRNA (cytosine(1402)-N(4))-methyltransferase RsmH [Deltaproteobacteria bacterium]|nr:16S rRNA (cytosine(1402)-N(4))-methyltransferase RsmH [Deltaproteobacteria bacterium]
MHLPVLAVEAIAALAIKPGGRYLDGTLGMGGHTGLILEKSDPDGMVIGLDQDAESLELARSRLARYEQRIHLRAEHFSRMGRVLDELGITELDGILLDLGMSSWQLEHSGRGFTFRLDQPLDMRMDPRGSKTAADLVNVLSEAELVELLTKYGEVTGAKRLAKAIIKARSGGAIERSAQMADIVARAMPGYYRAKKIHPATQVFQALRIAVNDELGAISTAIPVALERLRSGGRLAVISFHSLEDRIVKRAFRSLAHPCVCPPRMPECGCGRKAQVNLVFNRAIKPGPEEITANPRSRSARLRAVEKL